MKRMMLVMLSALLVLALAGCVQNKGTESTPEPAPSWIVLPETEG